MSDPNDPAKNFANQFDSLRVTDQMRIAAGATPSRLVEQLQGNTAIDALKSLDAINERTRLASAGIDRFSDISRIAAGGVPSYIAEHLQGNSAINVLRDFDAVKERAGLASAGVNKPSALDTVARRLADQFKAIDDLRPIIPDAPSMPFRAAPKFDLPQIKNPILETNNRLKSIQERFDKMEAIALNGAEIATSLQMSAATFLDKFEAAAKDNDKTTKRAVWIGTIAIVVAILTPILQSAYTEIYRVPADAASMQAAISDIKREMEGLQKTQALVPDKISDALAKNAKPTNQVLEEIRDLLKKQEIPNNASAEK